MSRTLRLAATLSLVALGTSSAHAAGPDAADPADSLAGDDTMRVIDPAHPWARVMTGELSKSRFEQEYGAEAEAARQQFQPFEQDGVVYDKDSWSADMFKALELPPPLHAENYEPTVGVLYVEMNGVTLSPNCGSGDSANAALNCSPLVDNETTFPAMSDGGAQAALFQQLATFYEPFNLVMTTNRPPEYLPYTMAVVGGSSQLAGHSGACGVANVACDGLKRNHVSLTFPQSCGGSAGTAAQETAHNWGLEHTDNSGDLMYPFNMGGVQSFIDSCMNISHATGDGNTQCGYVHEVYCPTGGGEVQNSAAELFGVFGPRVTDNQPPEIVDLQPAHGAVFSTDDEFTVTASITENSRMVGVRWTWLEGLPDGTDSYTKCTNNVCDEDFSTGASFDVSQVQWDFVNLDKPPVGTYSFRLEVIDAYGNSETLTTTVEVTSDGSDGGDDGADDGSDDGVDDGGDG
ncbi:MAG: hypothetical protein AAF721_38435, partial [Myxococcota bacterium]